MVVIEAHERSGSLITAACALEQGRDVMVVPGPVRSGRNRGAHALLKDGAALVECAADVLAELGICGPRAARDGTALHALSAPLRSSGPPRSDSGGAGPR